MKKILVLFIAMLLNLMNLQGNEMTERNSVHGTWNESREFRDPVSRLAVVQLTSQGVYNQGPTVHLNRAFIDGGRAVIFASVRDGRSYLLQGDLATGNLSILMQGPVNAFYNAADPAGTMRFRETIQGNNIAGTPDGKYAAVITLGKNTLHLVDVKKKQALLWIDPAENPEWFLCTPEFSADGKDLIVPVVTWSVKESYDTRTRNPMDYLSWSVEGNRPEKPELLLHHEWGQPHIIANPVFPDLFLVKLGRPSHLVKNRDRARKQPSLFILNKKDKSLRAVLPRDPYKDITHISWNYRGDRIVYHGPARSGGNFIGAMGLDGKVIWEHCFTDWKWEVNGENHIAADTVSDMIIDDGIAVKGQISLIDYRNAGASGKPAIYPVAQHGTLWHKLPGQLVHPHPNMSPCGKFLQFNAFRDNATHVYLVKLDALRESLKK